MRWRILFGFFWVCVFSNAQASESLPPNLESAAADINRYLDECERQPQLVPGVMSGSLLVAVDGHVLVNRAFGFANLEWLVPTAPDTKYLLASVSKPIVASAILRLRDQGRLSLDDSLAKFLPDVPEAWREIKIKHLLSHTSGIDDLLRSYKVVNGRAVLVDAASYRVRTTGRALLQRYNAAPLKSAPGVKYAYNNLGYAALGAVLEEVCQKPLEAALSELVFKPAGMVSSGVYDAEKVYPRWASPYLFPTSAQRTNPVAELAVRRPEYVDPTWLFSSGGLYSTVEDLRRFVEALSAGMIVSAESLAEMCEPTEQSRAVGDPHHLYALGWDIDEDRDGMKVVWHVGAGPGINNELIWYPRERIVLVTLLNGPLSGISSRGNFDQVIPKLILQRLHLNEFPKN